MRKHKIVNILQQIWVLKEPRSQGKIKIFLIIKDIKGIPHFKEIKKYPVWKQDRYLRKRKQKWRWVYTNI